MPATVTEHWLVWPGCTLAGRQETLTEVMVEDCVDEVKLPPVQPARPNAPKKRRLSAALLRIMLLPFRDSESALGNRLTIFCYQPWLPKRVRPFQGILIT